MVPIELLKMPFLETFWNLGAAENLRGPRQMSTFPINKDGSGCTQDNANCVNKYNSKMNHSLVN
jgi:hypothetical protein